MAIRTEDLRTIALIGHGHSGKTSLVEAMLRVAKAPGSRGVVDTAANGLEPEEKERKHTLVSHLHRIDVHGVRIQALDTPGHPDFVADAISALHCADIACLVVSAATPLSFHARQLWRLAGEAGRARAIVVTHLDHDGKDFHAFLGSLRTTLGHAVAPVSYPVAGGAKFDAVRDVLTHHSPRADQYHDWIEEDEAEVDSSSGVIEEDDCKPLAPPGTSGHGTPRSQFREIIREKLGATLESTGNRNRSMTSRLERMQANQDYR